MDAKNSDETRVAASGRYEVTVVVDGVPGASATAEYGIGIINEDATVAWLLAETLRRHRENFNESPQALGLRRLVPPGPNGLVAAGKMDGEMQEYGVDVPALALLTDVAYPGARFLTLPYDVRPSMQGRGQSFKTGFKKLTNMVHGIKGFIDNRRDQDSRLPDEAWELSDGEGTASGRGSLVGGAPDLRRARSAGRRSLDSKPHEAAASKRSGSSSSPTGRRSLYTGRRLRRMEMRRGSSSDPGDASSAGSGPRTLRRRGNPNMKISGRKHKRQATRSLSPSTVKGDHRPAVLESSSAGLPCASPQAFEYTSRVSINELDDKSRFGSQLVSQKRGTTTALRITADSPDSDADTIRIRRGRSYSETSALIGKRASKSFAGSALVPEAPEVRPPVREPKKIRVQISEHNGQIHVVNPLAKPSLGTDTPEVDGASAAASTSASQVSQEEAARNAEAILIAAVGLFTLVMCGRILITQAEHLAQVPSCRDRILALMTACAFVGFGANEWARFVTKNISFSHDAKTFYKSLRLKVSSWARAFSGAKSDKEVAKPRPKAPIANLAKRPPAGSTLRNWERERDPVTKKIRPVAVENHEKHTWCEMDASEFSVRSVGYSSHRQKVPSGDALYEVFAADSFHSDCKLLELSSLIRIPKPPKEYLAPTEELPSVVVFNSIMPTEAPSIWGGPEGEDCYSTVWYCRLAAWVVEELRRPASERSTSVRLAIDYFAKAPDSDAFAGRLKGMVAIPNMEVLGLPSAIKRMNGKPVLLSKVLSFVKTTLPDAPSVSVVEIDCDVFKFGLLARKGLSTFFPKFHLCVQNIAFVIEGREDDELPEQALFGVTMNYIDKAKVPDFDDVIGPQASGNGETNGLETLLTGGGSEKESNGRGSETGGRNKIMKAGFRIFGKQLRRRRQRGADGRQSAATSPRRSLANPEEALPTEFGTPGLLTEDVVIGDTTKLTEDPTPPSTRRRFLRGARDVNDPVARHSLSDLPTV